LAGGDSPRHIVSISDASLAWWDELYSLCRQIIQRPEVFSGACRGKLMASLFFEPSTRTKFSFQTAMLRLGGGVFGFENANDISAAKGESLADTIRMTATYSDVIVMRSPYEGAAKAASLYSEVPVINAGDGGHMHPTQTLSDLATIAQTRGGIGGITVGLCGDLKYGRTVHSLVTALAMFPDIKFVLISPNELAMPDYMLKFMRARDMVYDICGDLRDALPSLDVLYMTRAQTERAGGGAGLSDAFMLNAAKLQSAKSDLVIMHPLPRVNEISPDVDSDPRAKYFDQARFGMYIRMALLLKLTALGRSAPEAAAATGGSRCENAACVTRRELYLPPLKNADGSCAYCDTTKQLIIDS